MANDKDDDILNEAKNAYEQDLDHWSEIYDKAREDLRFLSDDKYAQWDKADYEDRTSTNRPALTIDQLGQFVHQVVNDIRQNTPSINVIPDGSDADIETAEIYKGLIRNIEYKSNAEEVYDTAATFSVKSSIGWIRIDHDYCDDEGFDQELKLIRVHNPSSVVFDRGSVDADGCDAMRGGIKDKITVAEFKRRWPKAEVSCFETKDKNFDNAKDTDEVTIFEWFKVVEESKTVTPDAYGKPTEYVDGDDDEAETPVKKRSIKKRKVMRYLLSGKEVLEQTVFPGKYIPLVPVFGEEHWVDGERELFSLIRKSKQAQQMYNLWKSLETELIMKQPNAPVMVGEGQIEDYMDDWKNPAKSMALRYKTHDADGNALPAPQRLEPPTIPTGIVNAARETVDDIKATMGLYNASIGNRSNETSGVAIDARKHEGDVATYHFADNLNRAIAMCGKILVYAIPEIYDTARIIRIIGEEDEPKEVGINGQPQPDGDPKTFDLKKGKFQVKVITGPSFTTRRQEAAQFFSDVVTKQPALMQVMGDLLFKNSDVEGAQAMASRMKKLIDPKLLTPEERDQMAKENQGQPDPQMEQAQQAIQQLQAALQDAQKQLQDKQGDQQVKVMDTQSKNEIDKLKIQFESQSKEADQRMKGLELLLRERELDIQEQQVSGTLAINEYTAKMDNLLGMMSAIQSSLPSPDNQIGSPSPDQSDTSSTATNGVQ